MKSIILFPNNYFWVLLNSYFASYFELLNKYILILPGVGALYVRRRPRVRVEAPQSGGGQERGMRSGTVPTPLVVGLGAACRIAAQEMEVFFNSLSNFFVIKQS